MSTPARLPKSTHWSNGRGAIKYGGCDWVKLTLRALYEALWKREGLAAWRRGLRPTRHDPARKRLGKIKRGRAAVAAKEGRQKKKVFLKRGEDARGGS